ncbi:unnamed protein product [Cyprideis torosa]|uniref:Uncharacterized protein n=1 Tax=Cyprideis torosa TaxID=163714 RepID=A0A7R8ZJE1_9CRUS|nr:unnamed protein product [Cyprideis torosa]CAG0879635.1 unnamed protein product [Cyprideis torosa]
MDADPIKALESEIIQTRFTKSLEAICLVTFLFLQLSSCLFLPVFLAPLDVIQWLPRVLFLATSFNYWLALVLAIGAIASHIWVHKRRLSFSTSSILPRRWCSLLTDPGQSFLPSTLLVIASLAFHQSLLSVLQLVIGGTFSNPLLELQQNASEPRYHLNPHWFFLQSFAFVVALDFATSGDSVCRAQFPCVQQRPLYQLKSRFYSALKQSMARCSLTLFPSFLIVYTILAGYLLSSISSLVDIPEAQNSEAWGLSSPLSSIGLWLMSLASGFCTLVMARLALIVISLQMVQVPVFGLDDHSDPKCLTRVLAKTYSESHLLLSVSPTSMTPKLSPVYYYAAQFLKRKIHAKDKNRFWALSYPGNHPNVFNHLTDAVVAMLTDFRLALTLSCAPSDPKRALPSVQAAASPLPSRMHAGTLNQQTPVGTLSNKALSRLVTVAPPGERITPARYKMDESNLRSPISLAAYLQKPAGSSRDSPLLTAPSAEGTSGGNYIVEEVTYGDLLMGYIRYYLDSFTSKIRSWVSSTALYKSMFGSRQESTTLSLLQQQDPLLWAAQGYSSLLESAAMEVRPFVCRRLPEVIEAFVKLYQTLDLLSCQHPDPSGEGSSKGLRWTTGSQSQLRDRLRGTLKQCLYMVAYAYQDYAQILGHVPKLPPLPRMKGKIPKDAYLAH